VRGCWWDAKVARAKKEAERGARDRLMANLKITALENIAVLIEDFGINILEPLGIDAGDIKKAFPDYFKQ